jgi:hypothetical protein
MHFPQDNSKGKVISELFSDTASCITSSWTIPEGFMVNKEQYMEMLHCMLKVPEMWEAKI